MTARIVTCALALALCGCSGEKVDPAKAALDKALADAAREKEDAARAKTELELVKHRAEAARLAAIAGKPERRSFLTPALVGKWALDGSSSKSMEFFPDGTVRDAAAFTSANGTYSVLDGGRVKLVFDGFFLGGTGVWGYAIAGDRLTLTLEGKGVELKYKRVR